MASGTFRFDEFVVDPRERRLWNGGELVELNGRYFDALTLLISDAGKLVSKDRFLDEVWRGVPVTDEALTQCIKTLRRQLGDDAARPRFIETVPKHGYRFIGQVERESETTPPATARSFDRRAFLALGTAGTIGGGLAGLIGGLIYGFAGASQPLAPGPGAVSVLLVLVCLCVLVSLTGAAGVSFGIAAADIASNRKWHWYVIGGAGGGLAVGAFVKLVGLDAFSLLLGRSPGDITGPVEGTLIGGAVGLGSWLAGHGWGRRRAAAIGGLAGGAAGVLVTLLGGRLMAGSLDLLARSMPGSRLRLDQLGSLFGESGFGPVTQVATGGLEGALFGACVVGSMMVARRQLGDPRAGEKMAPRA
jgi:DNA-binding winged helix-turn-helix (wHTH) protein